MHKGSILVIEHEPASLLSLRPDSGEGCQLTFTETAQALAYGFFGPNNRQAVFQVASTYCARPRHVVQRILRAQRRHVSCGEIA